MEIVPVSPVPMLVPSVAPGEEETNGNEQEWGMAGASVAATAPQQAFAGYRTVGWNQIVPVSPVPVFVPVLEDPMKKNKKKVKEGTWHRRYNRDEGKYWEHTGTKKRMLQDPYV